MKEQMRLLEQTLEGAISDVVEACGGWKRVGAELRPQMEPEEAGRWLQKCLDPARREVLQYKDMQLLLRVGRRYGVHALADFMMKDAAYEAPRPVDLAKEVELVNKDVDHLMALMRARIDRFDQVRAVISGPPDG